MSCDALEFVDPTGKIPQNEIERKFSVQPDAKRDRILKGVNTTDGSFSARGGYKRRRKSRRQTKQTKKIAKKSRKPRK